MFFFLYQNPSFVDDSSVMKSHIFREYDVRGRVGEELSHDIAIDLGKGIGTYLKRAGARNLAISGDVRLSTPDLMAGLEAGLLSTGLDVVDLGCLPTPVHYFSLYHLEIDGGIQVTGSHNPPDFNGFKISQGRAPCYGPAIQEIKALIESKDYETGSGKTSRDDVRTPYIEMIKSKIHFESPVSAVMDCANAAGAIIYPALYRELGVDLHCLYCDVDGTFPNHHPDPTVDANLADVMQLMRSGQYQAGIAFDGDADRIGVVDNKGRIIRADILMAFFVARITEAGDSVVYDVKSSRALEETIRKFGGKPVMSATGHSIIKEKVKKLNCKIGGELSGHIFLADDFYGFDDAPYVGLRLLEVLSKVPDRTLADLIDEFPAYQSSPEIRLECPDDEQKFIIAKKAAEYFKENYTCSEIDGVRIEFEDGWALMRASNTQPEITCRFEAQTTERLHELQDLVFSKLKSLGLQQ